MPAPQSVQKIFITERTYCFSTPTHPPPVRTAATAQAVTGAVRFVIEGAGHMPHMERPVEVQTVIEDTIARAG